MSLSLYFDGKLLSGGRDAQSAVVHLENGDRLEVHLDSKIELSGRPPRRDFLYFFAMQLKDLPPVAQEWVRTTASAIQKRYHDDAPTEVYPLRGGLLPTQNARGQVVNHRGAPIKNYQPRSLEPVKVEKPPATIALADDNPCR